MRSAPRVGALSPVKMSGLMEGRTTASCKTRFTPVIPAMSDQCTDGVVIKISDSTAALQDASSAMHGSFRPLHSETSRIDLNCVSECTVQVDTALQG